MTKTELLFREFRRDEAISFAEFKNAGWKVVDYLEYINICEQIRAFCICEDNISTLPGINDNNFCNVKEKAFRMLNSKLNEFLSKFFDRQLEIYFESTALSGWVDAHLCLCPHNEEEMYASMIFSTSEMFRLGIERIVNIKLTDDMEQIYGDNLDVIKTEDLKEEIQTMRQILSCNTPPEMPNFESSYATLQEWATEYGNYWDIENSYEDTIEILEEAIENRIDFDVRKHTLYVYSKPPVCERKHNVKSVTANIPFFNGENIKINIYYCLDCKNFFITYDEYEQYLKQYKFLPVRFFKIDEGTQNNGYGKRKDKSFLRLCGYEVSKKTGLTDLERREILAHLLDNGVFKKYEIINHLDMLIDTNGEKPSNYDAREKWISDLRFVMDHKLSEQNQVAIDEIKSASKNLK